MPTHLPQQQQKSRLCLHYVQCKRAWMCNFGRAMPLLYLLCTRALPAIKFLLHSSVCGASLSLNPHRHGSLHVMAAARVYTHLSSVKNDGPQKRRHWSKKTALSSGSDLRHADRRNVYYFYHYLSLCVRLVACQCALSFFLYRQFLFQKDYNGKFNNSLIFK